jgi:MinD-like ATPase involved in chromosome partitioning or flagellar assembly
VEQEQFPHIFSFVSGKGGVGKTCLAANFAWLVSKSRKALLLDLDLQNQGATGLFAKWIDRDRIGVLESLLDKTAVSQAISDVAVVSENLLFMPAASFANASSPGMIADLATTEDFTERLSFLLDQLRQTAKCDVIIVDCHGGLDYLSLTAHRLSDRTIVVTEPDTVTFNGTLELLSFYTGAKATRQSYSDGETYRPAPQFIVNRIPPKYTFDDLDRVYRNILVKYGTEFNVTPEVLCYIPVENFLSDSFGEYPFCAELAPNSVFSKKIHLMVFKLVHGVLSDNKIFRKFQSSRFTRRVERCLVSNSERNIQLIVRTFVLFNILFTAYCFLIVPAVLLFEPHRLRSEAWLSALKSPFVLIPAAILSCWILVTLFRALWGAGRYYADQYRFRRLLWTRGSRRPTLAERALLLRLLFLRSVIPIPLVFVGMFILELVVIVPLGLLTHWKF